MYYFRRVYILFIASGMPWFEREEEFAERSSELFDPVLSDVFLYSVTIKVRDVWLIV